MSCSDLTKGLFFAIECGPEIRNKITRVYMDTLGNVYDQAGNYIGHGRHSSETTVNVDTNIPDLKLIDK